MSVNITYKFADREDICRLGKLYKTVFNRSIGIAELEWLFTENPLIKESYYNYIALDLEGTVIGHTAFLPVLFMCEKDVLKGAVSVGSMIHPKNVGLFPQLLNKIEQRMIKEKFDFFYAFPNENSLPFFIRYFKYEEHFCNYLQLDINEIIHIKENVPCLFFSNAVHNRLSEDFLKWRIYDSPRNTYEVFENSNFNIIYKRYNEQQVDLICLSFKEEHFNLTYFVDFLLGIENAKKLNIYSTDPSFSNILSRLGFKAINCRNRFVCKNFSNVPRRNNFFLQMIDSDIF